MRNVTTLLASLLLALGMMSLAPTTVLAQSSGCPWCTTPSTCGEVDENTNSGGCYNIGAGCQSFPGSCTINETFADVGRESTLERNGIEYHGTTVADLWGTKVELTAINDGLFADWGCAGQLTALFRRSPSGNWIEVETAEYKDRYALEQPQLARATFDRK